MERIKNNFLKRNQTVCIILGIWALLCLLYYYYFVSTKNATICLLNKLGDGFGVSFSASFLEDLVVFFCLSLIILILTTRKLWSYSFNEKIEAIVNSKNAQHNQKLIDFFNATCSRLLAYDKDLRISITVTDYDKEKNAYKLYLELKYNITNMCRDKDFEISDDYYFTVSPSDAIVNQEYGHITHFSRTNLSSKTNTVYVDEPTQVKLSEKFKQKVDLSIAKDSEIELHLKYYTWSKTGMATTRTEIDLKDTSPMVLFKSDRYVQTTSISITNNMKNNMSYEVYLYHYKDRQNEKNGVYLHHNKELSKGVSDAVEKINGLPPTDDIRIYFYKQ